MKEIIDWLREIERQACVLYKDAAALFADDERLSPFLARMAEDEAWHYHLMGSAADFVASAEPAIPPGFSLDAGTRESVEAPLREFQDRIAARRMEPADAVACCAAIERSEWNPVFLYVIDRMKKHDKTFEYIAASIQAHAKRFEQFMDGLPAELRPPTDGGALPRIWTERVLIVEDEGALRDLLARFLAPLGEVETAEHGAVALEKVKRRFFNVILCDLNMPVMDGIEFYRQTLEANPPQGAAFLFYSGYLTPERETFLKGQGVPYLEKPMRLRLLRKAVEEVLRKSV